MPEDHLGIDKVARAAEVDDADIPALRMTLTIKIFNGFHGCFWGINLKQWLTENARGALYCLTARPLAVITTLDTLRSFRPSVPIILPFSSNSSWLMFRPEISISSSAAQVSTAPVRRVD